MIYKLLGVVPREAYQEVVQAPPSFIGLFYAWAAVFSLKDAGG